MGAAARERMEKLFGAQKQAQEYLALFDSHSLIAKRPARPLKH
jgi:hypothetical protein